MEAPTRLNGYPVLDSRPSPARGSKVEGLVVLIKRADECDYATAFWAPHLGRSWHQGHYGLSWQQAVTDMLERAERG